MKRNDKKKSWTNSGSFSGDEQERESRRGTYTITWLRHHSGSKLRKTHTRENFSSNGIDRYKVEGKRDIVIQTIPTIESRLTDRPNGTDRRTDGRTKSSCSSKDQRERAGPSLPPQIGWDMTRKYNVYSHETWTGGPYTHTITLLSGFCPSIS